MEFTEVSNDDGVVTIEVSGRGFSGIAKVSIETGIWPIRDIEDCLAPYVSVRFQDGVKINGKEYDAWRVASKFHPYWHGQDEREVLTNRGIQKLPYMSDTGARYGELTDSARSKLRELTTMVADKYLTTEASKAAIVRSAQHKVVDAITEKEKAEAEVQARIDALDSARSYLTEMEQL
ncbi:hypothetical protein BKG70_01160 [Mycobacteroides chelonae]|uniref:hypothetical protein n=1 Tax=Mycobacteroides chelonae TaxID=1774 RepID=UPI0008A85570|nr:hypothetical protein [Mycobacteroides chelonae]OHT91355.1 hypothetical protein BKG70_01160 [Mycobacteroides chelonae]